MSAFTGVGGGPCGGEASENGGIDAISHIDPVISKLQHDKSVFILADSRTEAGTKAIFGGSNPAAVLYLKREFIEKNPQTVQALVNAFHHALLWLAKIGRAHV